MQVWLGTVLETGTPVAVKVAFNEPFERECLNKEARVLLTLDEPHIVFALGFIQLPANGIETKDPDSIDALVMEFCPLGTLADVVNSHHLAERQAQKGPSPALCGMQRYVNHNLFYSGLLECML